jgi:hypothetical protein
MSYHSPRPFFYDPTFYPSPPKIWDLFSYANDTAIELASGSYHTIILKSYPCSCLELCDIEALESDREVSSYGSRVIQRSQHPLLFGFVYWFIGSLHLVLLNLIVLTTIHFSMPHMLPFVSFSFSKAIYLFICVLTNI